MAWSELGEITKAIAPVFTAGAACFAAWIGYRGLTKWQSEMIGKRKAELAEDVLSNFYQAEEIIHSIRSPLAYGSESKDRIAPAHESESIKRLRDTYYAPLARFEQHMKFFADLRTKRHRMKALLGPKVEKPFDSLHRAIVTITVSARMLIETVSDYDDDRADPKLRQEWQSAIWERSPGDELATAVSQAVADMEAICRPLLETRRGTI